MVELTREENIIILERLRALGKIRFRGSLKNHSGNNIQIHCPFHDDRKPSLRIELNRGVWTCFPCNKDGNLETFCREFVGQSARSFIGKPELFDYKNISPVFIQKNNIPEFPSLIILGFTYPALEIRASYNYLLNRRITEKIALSMKILYTEECSINGSLMKNRILIPMYNSKNELIGVEGRAVNPKENPPKVLYPKNTNKPIYEEHLLDKEKPLYIVEGLMDLARLKEDSRFVNSTATFGTGLTFYQRSILNQFNRIIMIPDNDVPGLKFAKQLKEYFKDKFSVLRIRNSNIKDVGDIPIPVSDFYNQNGFIEDDSFNF